MTLNVIYERDCPFTVSREDLNFTLTFVLNLFFNELFLKYNLWNII